jgi:hypothetical protein
MTVKDLPERIAYLILMYLLGELTPALRDELDSWVAETEDHSRLFHKIMDSFD